MNAGTWRCRVGFAPGAAAGTWRIGEVILRDGGANERRYGAGELESARWPTSFAVVSAASDVSAPVLTALAFTPTALDLTDSSQTVRFTARLRDEGTGVQSVQFTLSAPPPAADQGQHVRCWAMTVSPARHRTVPGSVT
jgi:hypothetical protein